ncbi:MAG: hypothetical protein ACW992_12160 [Candidatus Thorarchaeota archaeon]|jgi:uncharacterized membrane protein HdeD (DUF308 family)
MERKALDKGHPMASPKGRAWSIFFGIMDLIFAYLSIFRMDQGPVYFIAPFALLALGCVFLALGFFPKRFGLEKPQT